MHLYSLNMTTREMHQLTSGPQCDLAPAWSPDQRKVAFVSNRAGQYDLYVMNADGSGVRRLTNSADDEESPQWSPDGTQIAYVVAHTLPDHLEERHLYRINAQGGRSTQLTSGPGSELEPSWSPDGRFLVFIRGQDVVHDGVTYTQSSVHLLDLSTDRDYLLDQLDSTRFRFAAPQWLPRQPLALSVIQSPGEMSPTAVKVFELDWRDSRPILNLIFVVEEATGHYTWGPDGGWLVIVSNNHQTDMSAEGELRSRDLLLVPIEYARRQVAIWDALADGRAEWVTNNEFYDDYPDWVH